MQGLRHTRSPTSAAAPERSLAAAGKPVGRFLPHLAEMCMVMCGSGIILSVAFFQGAAASGYPNLPHTAPELSILVIAINLLVPMAAWMRYRGMGWRPTLEMTIPITATGMLLIAAYWLDLVATGSPIGMQTSLACPVMLAAMLFRFPLCSAPHSAHHARAARTRCPGRAGTLHSCSETEQTPVVRDRRVPTSVPTGGFDEPRVCPLVPD